MSRYYAPTRVYFAEDCLDRLAIELETWRSVMIVTDPGIREAGILQHVETALRDAGVGFDVFDGVEGNPSIHQVAAAAGAAAAASAEALIAVGGGSAIDVAKAAAVALTNGGVIADYEGFDRLVEDPMPLVAVPTTCGSGSEVTKGCVITNPDTNVKMIVVSDRMYPRSAFLDRRMIAGLPGFLVAVTGADALTHAIEAYIARGANPFSDSLVLESIRLITRNLGPAVEGDEVARHNMLIASTLAGLGFPNAGLGLVHAIANTVGGVYGLHHGTTNAVVLPFVLKFNASAAPQRYRNMAQAAGMNVTGADDEDKAQAFVEVIAQLLRDVGVPSRLGELGVGTERIEEMADMAMVQLDRPGNPRDNDREDILRLLTEAI